MQPGEVLSVGRSSESDLQLLDLGISRFHCAIEAQADGMVVTDLNSSNGTFVNGQRVKRQPLAEGDEIGMGPVRLRVERVPVRRRASMGGFFTDLGATDARVVRPAAPGSTALFRPHPGARRAVDEARIQRDLQALYKIGNEINAQVSIERLLAVVMDTVLEVIRAERGFVLVADGATGEVQPRVARIVSGRADQGDLPISLPIVRECMERGLAVLCPDLKSVERYHEGDSLLLDHIRSVLCVPLGAGASTVGAIYLDTASDHAPFGDHDLDLLTAIAGQAGLALHRAQLIESLERLFLGAIETLVATVEAKDIYTYGHSARVSKLSRQIAERMGLSEKEQETIKIAGLLHDIGKVGIPESILGKPGKLTDEEWAYIRSHPQIGASIIHQMGSERLADVEPIVRHHHERLDGRGYPDGLAGDAIPVGARIMGVADAYDAMTSNRPYRAPFTAEAAIEELRRGIGSQFERQAVEAFIEIRVGRLPGAAEVTLAAKSDDS